MTRYYGAYANRNRKALSQKEWTAPLLSCTETNTDERSATSPSSRASWARLIRKIFEVDPLICKCGAEMKLIALVTEPKLVDRILRHLEKNATAARAPPPPSKPLDENETVPAHVNV